MRSYLLDILLKQENQIGNHSILMKIYQRPNLKQQLDLLPLLEILNNIYLHKVKRHKYSFKQLKDLRKSYQNLKIQLEKRFSQRIMKKQVIYQLMVFQILYLHYKQMVLTKISSIFCSFYYIKRVIVNNLKILIIPFSLISQTINSSSLLLY